MGVLQTVRKVRNITPCSSDRDTQSLPINVLPFKSPEWVHDGPDAALAHLPDESSAAGLEPDLEEVRAALEAIPPSAIATESDWMKIARALAHAAAIHKDYTKPLWELLDTASRRAPGYNEEDNRQRFQRYIGEAFNRQKPITLETLFVRRWSTDGPGGLHQLRKR